MRRRHSRRAAVPGILLLVTAVAGCGDMAKQAQADEYCIQYDQLAARADVFSQQAVADVPLSHLRARVDRFQAELAQLVAASDGRLDTGYSQLQVALDDLRQSVASSDPETAAQGHKMIADAFDEVQKQWAAFQGQVAAECT